MIDDLDLLCDVDEGEEDACRSVVLSLARCSFRAIKPFFLTGGINAFASGVSGDDSIGSKEGETGDGDCVGDGKGRLVTDTGEEDESDGEEDKGSADSEPMCLWL